MKYINGEETAYRKLQKVLKAAIDNGQDEFSDEDESPPSAKRLLLPKRLLGWHFLERG